MTEHRGTSFAHSCVKVPVDPYSRQPTPSYERPRILKTERCRSADKQRRINFTRRDSSVDLEYASPRETMENFLEFIESIPDYGDVHHLSNEQFKRKVDYLRRKQKILLENLRNCVERDESDNAGLAPAISKLERNETGQRCTDYDDLNLRGKKCNFEESRSDSPMLFSSARFAALAEDQDLLTYRCKNKDAKTLLNKEIHSARKSWSMSSESKSMESVESDAEDSVETKSLPPSSPKRWHPTVPKPFNFTLRDDAKKYMALTESQVEERSRKKIGNKKILTKRRRVRPIPWTSKLPLYDKLLAEKEERSRMVREESAWSLMSQVRPFNFESTKRALTRSNPELRPLDGKNASSISRFKAKPVPKNLFGTEIYDRMLEDDFYRTLKNKIRAAELLKSSSLPPSMAMRDRIKSANAHLRNLAKEFVNDCPNSLPSERSRSASVPSSILSMRGNNLAAVLRCQASRKKIEHEIQERMEEKQREKTTKMRESLVRCKPAWKALRCAARHEHERDLFFRTALRRDEAREQAECHRLQMELMLDRVTQIPTLFERHSQNFQTSLTFPLPVDTKGPYKLKKGKKTKRERAYSVDSYVSLGNSSRSNSGSLTSPYGTLVSSCQSSKSYGSRKSGNSSPKSTNLTSKKKGDRGPLKVSINETAVLIEDLENDERYSSDPVPGNEHTVSVSESEKNESVKN